MGLRNTKFLNSDERAYFLRLVANDNTRDGAMLWLNLHCGMRPSELLRLTKRDFDFREHSVSISASKRSNDRVLPLSPKLSNRIKELTADLGLDDRVFPISYSRFYAIHGFYKPSKHSPKAFRHTVAERTWATSKDLRTVQQVLGHKSLSSTERYLTSRISLDSIRKVLVD